MNLVQRLILKFSGDNDLLEFLQRLEELAECCHDRLLPTHLGNLQGNALNWFRVKKTEITSWTEFREKAEKFLLSKRFITQLKQLFYNRQQKNWERAKHYILQKLTTVIQHPQLREMNPLDRIYEGLKPEYRHYIRRHDFHNLEELIEMADYYELLRRDEARHNHPHTSLNIEAGIPDAVTVGAAWNMSMYDRSIPM